MRKTNCSLFFENSTTSERRQRPGNFFLQIASPCGRWFSACSRVLLAFFALEKNQWQINSDLLLFLFFSEVFKWAKFHLVNRLTSLEVISRPLTCFGRLLYGHDYTYFSLNFSVSVHEMLNHWIQTSSSGTFYFSAFCKNNFGICYVLYILKSERGSNLNLLQYSRCLKYVFVTKFCRWVDTWAPNPSFNQC